MRKQFGRLAVLGIVAAAPGFVFAAQSPAHAARVSSSTVRIGDIFFRPKTLKVKKGATVRWNWTGKLRHNVTFTRLGAHSPTQRHGSYSLRFNKKGTYHYLCTVHGITGTIVVS
jgi:plastocyanin